MKVSIKGKQTEFDLTQNDFIASGGQGSVYSKGNTAFKIYTDPNNMIPESKIRELSVLTDKNIIKPEDVLIDKKNKVIGYTMRYVKDTFTLCQMFPKAFRQREGLTEKQTVGLVKNLRDLIEHIHSQNILVVDLNEMNFLLSKKLDEVYAIDVDSYQTKSFPATVLMESVRDRHSKNKFDDGTDWFSYAVTSFQMFIGIHPYKGKHDTIKTIDDRMIKNVSVLNSDVSIPPVCLPFNVIPSNYLDWYTRVFEKGERIAPPLDGQVPLNTVNHVQIKKINGTNNFNIDKLGEFQGTFYKLVPYGASNYMLTDKGVLEDFKLIDSTVCKDLIFTSKKKEMISINKVNSQYEFYYNNTKFDLGIIVDDVNVFNNLIYVKSGSSIIELDFIINQNRVTTLTKVIGKVMEKTSRLFSGCIIQKMLGSLYFSFYPKSGFFYELRIPQLEAYKVIIDAKYNNKICVVTAKDKNGQIDQLIFRFNDAFSEYDVRVFSDITTTDINYVVLDNGLCVMINPNKQVDIFTNKFGSSPIMKTISDPVIDYDMELFNNGIQVLFVKNNQVFSIKTK